MARLSIDGTKILENYDRFTGVPFNATKVTTWYDGSAMDDSKVDNAIYLKVPSNLGGGYAKRDFDGAVFPEWWGAVGNGTVNDTVALQKAIDSGYRVLISKNKTFLYRATLILPSNCVIEGEDKLTSVLKADVDNFTYRNNWNPATIVNANAKLASNSDDFSNPNSSISIKNLSIRMSSDTVTNMQSILRFSAMIGLSVSSCIFKVSSTTAKGHNAVIDLHASYRDVAIKDSVFEITTNSPNYGGAIWVQNEGAVTCENVEVSGNQFTVASKDETLAIYTINGTGIVKNVKAFNNIITKPDYTTSPSSMLTVFGKAQDVDIYDNWLFSSQVAGSIDGILRVGVASDNTNVDKPTNIKIHNNRLIGVFTTSKGLIGYSGDVVQIYSNIVMATNATGTTNVGIFTPNSSLSKNWDVFDNNITNFFTGINGGSIVEKNVITNASTAILGYRKIANNVVIGAKLRAIHVVGLGNTENYEISGNQLDLTNNATEAIGLATGTFGMAKTYIGHNIIKAAAGGSTKGVTQISGAGTIGTVQEDNNTFSVTGTALDIPAIETLVTTKNLAGLTNLSTARTNLGLGSIATQASNNIAITGGAISGLTSLGALESVIGIYSKTAINATAAFFAGITPTTSVSPTVVTSDSYEQLAIMRNTVNSASQVLRRLGYIFKLSNESSATESNKSGGIILESIDAFSNIPDLHLVIGTLKALTAKFSGELQFNGAIATKIGAKTAGTYTLTALENTVLADATTGNVVLTLPTASLVTGREYIVKRIDNTINTVIIGATIDGIVNYQMLSLGTVKVKSNGTEWKIIESSFEPSYSNTGFTI